MARPSRKKAAPGVIYTGDVIDATQLEAFKAHAVLSEMESMLIAARCPAEKFSGAVLRLLAHIGRLAELRDDLERSVER